MSTQLLNLHEDERTGSKPRCHWLTHGEDTQVAARLTKMIQPWGEVSANDRWMPEGFSQTDEAELHEADRLLEESERVQSRDWWFAVVRGRQTAPSFDIASTCSVTVVGYSQRGILLVEAKAHDHELKKGEAGKPFGKKSSRKNHDNIGKVIAASNEPFAQSTKLKWSLSHESHYQMSNRFASACKLLKLGYAVILVYLGFLKAEEMRSGTKKLPFANHDEWASLVRTHSRPLFPDEVWDKQLTVHGKPLIPLIRSLETPYDAPFMEVADG